MFTKVNARQEQFLWLVVDGMPGSRAYAQVYGEHLSAATCEVNASKLLRQTKLIQRRNEMVAGRMAQAPITVKYLTGELLAVAGEARALGQGSAAVAAYQTVAKLHGLMVDKLQLDAIVRKPSESPESPDEMSEEDWLTKYGVINLTPLPVQPIGHAADAAVESPQEPSLETVEPQYSLGL